MGSEEPREVQFVVRLSPAAARFFLEDLAKDEGESQIRQEVSERAPEEIRGYLSENWNIDVSESALPLELPVPEDVRHLLAAGDVDVPGGPWPNPPRFDGPCRGMAIAFAAAGTAKDSH